LRMRSLAERVKRRAATVSLGTSSKRISSVTVPTWTMTFEGLSETFLVSVTIFDRETGARFVLERKRRRRMT
jgi:hypothetical protein